MLLMEEGLEDFKGSALEITKRIKELEEERQQLEHRYLKSKLFFFSLNSILLKHFITNLLFHFDR